MEESFAAVESVGMRVSDLSDPFDFRRLSEEERRHLIGSQNVPPSALKNRKNSGGPGGALRVSRVLADFGTGFPRRVESFAFIMNWPTGQRLPVLE
jgi:hypothetical protein